MLTALFGVLLIVLALHDSFEVMVLPRRVRRRWRLARFFYRTGWPLWRRLCLLLPASRYRVSMRSVFGPFSLFILFASWAFLLIAGFALIQWGFETLPVDSAPSFLRYLYLSGETFFTLGYGDLTPTTGVGMALAVIEAGTGFGFMAVTIGYLPVLYQAFSQRERSIALLDARAGSPPTAGELMHRVGPEDECDQIERFLDEWELWAATLLESHLSFPVLSYYHSQHDNQSWLATLAVILDTSAVLITTAAPPCRRRAELTFAMARHACVDLCLVFWLPPVAPERDRLTSAEIDQLFTQELDKRANQQQAAERLAELRGLYEPFLQALSNYFLFNLPRFFPDRATPDNWQTSAWTERAPALTALTAASQEPDEHFG